MSRGKGSSVISIAVFLAVILVMLPVSGENVTTSATTAVPSATTAVPSPAATDLPVTTTAVPATTLVPPPTTTAVPATSPASTQTTAAPSSTTAATTPATTAPVTTTVAVSRPTTVVTTANQTLPGDVPATTGSVDVYSSPAGASILIDGLYRGTTPGKVNGLAAGNHILRLTLSGYADYEGSIYIIPGQPAQGYGTLQPMSHVTPVAQTPVPTAVTAMIVTVATAAPQAAEDPGLLGDSSIIAAIIGAVAVIILSAAKIFTHIRPPKTE